MNIVSDIYVAVICSRQAGTVPGTFYGPRFGADHTDHLWAILCHLLSFEDPVYVQYAPFHHHHSTIVTVCRAPLNSAWMKLYVIGTTVLFFALPFCLLTIVYCISICKISKESKILRKSTGHYRGRANSLKARRKTVMMIGVVLVLFFFCLLPLRVLAIWLAYAKVEDVEALGFEACETLKSFVRVMFTWTVQQSSSV